MRRSHYETTAFLLVFCYMGAMLFFALVRAFGLLWFQAEYLETVMPEWLQFVVLCLLLSFDCFIKLKTLTLLKWRKIVVIVAVICAFNLSLSILPISIYLLFLMGMVTDVLLLVIVPLVSNRDKERSIGYSLLYILVISLYQGVMSFGRGYPMLAMFSPSWQIVSTIDYRMFLIGILVVKGVVYMWIFENPPRGCMLFFGKFDNIAKRIGHEILTIGGLMPHTHETDAHNEKPCE